jgi:hypothetical protein
MQATQQSRHIAPASLYMRVMATFGTLVAVVLIAAGLAYGAAVVVGSMSSGTATTTSSVSAPAAVAFRMGERAALAVSAQTAQSGFRAGERGDGTAAAATSNGFRAGERGDGTAAAATSNGFRAGERGDSK